MKYPIVDLIENSTATEFDALRIEKMNGQKFFRQIADFYDCKLADKNNLNLILGEEDCRFFNHSGLRCEFMYPQREEDLLAVLHLMELNLVNYALKHFAPLSKESLVLDAGCGAGGVSVLINETFGCRIDGFDLSAKQIELAKKVTHHLSGKSISFNVGNILHLPCQNRLYDMILACESSEHLPDLDSMFSEFHRVIKPSGSLVIIAWCAVNSRRGQELKSIVDDYYLTTIHTCEEYITSANRCGWRVSEYADLTNLTLPYWKLRKLSAHKTGSEEVFVEGYSTGNLKYSFLRLKPDNRAIVSF